MQECMGFLCFMRWPMEQSKGMNGWGFCQDSEHRLHGGTARFSSESNGCGLANGQRVVRRLKQDNSGIPFLLAKALGTTPEFWLNFQFMHDLQLTQHDEALAEQLKHARPLAASCLAMYKPRFPGTQKQYDAATPDEVKSPPLEFSLGFCSFPANGVY